MARTKLNQRSASRVAVPMGATGGRTPPSTMTVALLATCVLAALWAAAMLMPWGRMAYVYVFAYAEYYMGVLTLVSLSITVMIGLVATDRLVLSIRQRVLLQSAHRTTGMIAIVALGLHVATKLSIGHVRVVDVFVPFLTPYNTVYIGLGTIAGGMLVSVVWTGIARARFAGRGKPWMWRALHSVAYLSWPIALVHGLSAGRTAATWVVVSYVVCVLFVLVGLAVRLSVSLNRRKDFSSTSTGALKPVGAAAGGAAPAKRLSRRRPEVAAPAPVPAWRPAVAVAAAPAAAEPVLSAAVTHTDLAGTGSRPQRDAEPVGAGSRSLRDAGAATGGYRGGAELEPVRAAARRDDAHGDAGRRDDGPRRSGVPGRSADGRYDDGRHDDGRYDDGRYDGGRYDGRRHEDERYDEPGFDDRHREIARYEEPRRGEDRYAGRRAGGGRFEDERRSGDAADFRSEDRGRDASSRYDDRYDDRYEDAAGRRDDVGGRRRDDVGGRRRAAGERDEPAYRGGRRVRGADRYEDAGRYDDADRYEGRSRYDDADRYEGRARYEDTDRHEGRARYEDTGGHEGAGRFSRDAEPVRRAISSTPHGGWPGRPEVAEPVSRGRRRALEEAEARTAAPETRAPAGPARAYAEPARPERTYAEAPRGHDEPGRRYDDRADDRTYAEPYRDDRPRTTTEPPPRARGRARAADTGRHSRSEFVDLADPNYLPPDETPTLVDIAARRERRAERADSRAERPARPGRSSRRSAGRGRAADDASGWPADDLSDETYWRQLRGEAQ